MGFGTIYLDTNIFVMAFEGTDEASERLSEIFGNVDRQLGIRFATSELTLAELLVRPIRDSDPQAVAQYEELISPSPWMNVSPISRSTLSTAATLRAQSSNLKLPDAIHIATAMNANCSYILTNDYGIKGPYSRSFRQKLADQPVEPLAILRPDEPTLYSLIKSLSA